MTNMATQNYGMRSFRSASDVREFRLVTLDSASAVKLAGANDLLIGVTFAPRDNDGFISVRNRDSGTFKVAVALGKSVAVGDVVKAAANGAVEATEGAGIAVAVTGGTSSASDCAIIECAWIFQKDEVGTDYGGLIVTRTLGDVYAIDDQTAPEAGGEYQVPEGTSRITIDRATVTGAVTLLPPSDAPSVILITQRGGAYNAVTWGASNLGVCPIYLMIRADDEWTHVPLDEVFEYRMQNTVVDLDGVGGNVSVPAGAGQVNCDNLTAAVTLKFDGAFYPQIININNDDPAYDVTIESEAGDITVAHDGAAVIVNAGGLLINTNITQA